jgi:hypothetical protein
MLGMSDDAISAWADLVERDLAAYTVTEPRVCLSIRRRVYQSRDRQAPELRSPFDKP